MNGKDRMKETSGETERREEEKRKMREGCRKRRRRQRVIRWQTEIIVACERH